MHSAAVMQRSVLRMIVREFRERPHLLAEFPFLAELVPGRDWTTDDEPTDHELWDAIVQRLERICA